MTCRSLTWFEFLQVELGALLFRLAAGYMRRRWQVATWVFLVVDTGGCISADVGRHFGFQRGKGVGTLCSHGFDSETGFPGWSEHSMKADGDAWAGQLHWTCGTKWTAACDEKSGNGLIRSHSAVRTFKNCGVLNCPSKWAHSALQFMEGSRSQWLLCNLAPMGFQSHVSLFICCLVVCCWPSVFVTRKGYKSKIVGPHYICLGTAANIWCTFWFCLITLCFPSHTSCHHQCMVWLR